MPRARTSDEPPAGLEYFPDFLSADDEASWLAWLEQLEFHAVVMHGQAARRTVRHFGTDYEYGSGRVAPGESMPEPLLALRERCAALADVDADDLVEALVTRYPPGATIGWHRDAPAFGSPVIGVSFGSSCRMRFQRGKGEERVVYELELAPRSAYLIGGSSRWQWQHSIPPTKELRYSITFRRLRPS